MDEVEAFLGVAGPTMNPRPLVQRLRDAYEDRDRPRWADEDVLLAAAAEIERVNRVIDKYRSGLPDWVQYPDHECQWLTQLLDELSGREPIAGSDSEA